MKKEYANWISNNYPDKNRCINQCNEAVREIIGKFPELRIQVGYANHVFHCWTVDEQGLIVDPTAKQFDSDINYTAIANRFLRKHEVERSTGAIFLDTNQNT